MTLSVSRSCTYFKSCTVLFFSCRILHFKVQLTHYGTKSNVNILWFQVCLKVMIFELKQSQLWTIIWSMSNKISTQTSILFNNIYSTKREPNLLTFFQTKLFPQCLQCHQILKENASVILAPLGQMKTVKQDLFCVLISLFTLFVCLWYPLFSIAKC